MRDFFSHSSEETLNIGVEFGKTLKANDIICLTGDLAAGKTTFVKGVVLGAANYSPDLVHSPTFVYLNIYQADQTIYHFDLYRLRDLEEFLNMGFEDALFAGGICCIEWSERIVSLLPAHCQFVSLNHVTPTCRQISLQMRDRVDVLK